MVILRDCQSTLKATYCQCWRIKKIRHSLELLGFLISDIDKEWKELKKQLKIFLQFREDDYEEDDALMMAMKEIRQRRMDLNITFDEFYAVWMLIKLKKRKKIES